MADSRAGSVAVLIAARLVCPAVEPASALEEAPPGLAAGRRLLLKREDRHELGAFKWRGALPSLEAYREQGASAVVTASTGNHGAATAWAAQRTSLRSIVFMPEEVSQCPRSSRRLHLSPTRSRSPSPPRRMRCRSGRRSSPTSTPSPPISSRRGPRHSDRPDRRPAHHRRAQRPDRGHRGDRALRHPRRSRRRRVPRRHRQHETRNPVYEALPLMTVIDQRPAPRRRRRPGRLRQDGADGRALQGAPRPLRHRRHHQRHLHQGGRRVPDPLRRAAAGAHPRRRDRRLPAYGDPRGRLDQPRRHRRAPPAVPGARPGAGRIGRRQSRRHLLARSSPTSRSTSSTSPPATRSRGRAGRASPAPTCSSSTRSTSRRWSAPRSR